MQYGMTQCPCSAGRGRLLRVAVVVASVVTLCAVWATAALAGSSTYYTAPSSTDTTGSCTASAPCRLDRALALATGGDTVVVLPGTYSITYPLEANGAITVEGAPGQPRPRLIGGASLTSDTLEASGGATVRDLDIEATNNTGAQTSALSVEGGTVENVTVLVAASDSKGEALSVNDSAGGTLVRTVLARNEAPEGEAVSVTDSKTSPGIASFYNLTATAIGSNGEALSGNVATGTVTVKDSILSGQDSDISTKPGTRSLSVSYSDFRPADSSGFSDQGGNISSAPAFVNTSQGDFHESPTSPTIDAGAADAKLTANDLDGNPRSFGAAPDMGAYEYAGTALPPASPPVLGVSVTVRPASGSVRVKLPGGRAYVALQRAAQLPVGTVIDATHGRLQLSSAINRAGATKTGTFNGGAFVVDQARSGQLSAQLRLVGGSFAACHRARRVVHGRMVISHYFLDYPRRVIRQLWGRDRGGRFRTIGRTAAAAVRGTVWLTQDRCDGTLIRVYAGHVLVHDRVHRRNVLVGPGQSYLARG
jgi:hypothetical protein